MPSALLRTICKGSGKEIRGTRQEYKSQEAEDVARPLEDKPGGTRAAQCYLQIGMSEPPSEREKQKYPSTDWETAPTCPVLRGQSAKAGMGKAGAGVRNV
jgi:hypothetical protein